MALWRPSTQALNSGVNVCNGDLGEDFVVYCSYEFVFTWQSKQPPPHSTRLDVGLQHSWRDVMEALLLQTCYKSKSDLTTQRRYKVAPAHWRSPVPTFFSFPNVLVATLHLPQSQRSFSWLCGCWNATLDKATTTRDP